MILEPLLEVLDQFGNWFVWLWAGLCGLLLLLVALLVGACRRSPRPKNVIVGRSFLVLVVLAGIIWPFLGIEIENVETVDFAGRQSLPDKDDRLADKHPEYSAKLTQKRRGEGDERYYLNKSEAVIALDVVEPWPAEQPIVETLQPTFRKAREAAKGVRSEFLPSVDIAGGYSTWVDERLVTALELQMHDGSAVFPGGKQGLLRELLGGVQGRPAADGQKEAAAFLTAAIRLGGGEVAVAADISAQADAWTAEFLADTSRSRPVGLFSQTETLQRIFRRDRFLQQPFGWEFWGDANAPQAIGATRSLLPVIRMAEVLAAQPEVLAAYQRFQQLNETISNPRANLNLADLVAFQDVFGSESALANRIQQSEAWQTSRRRENLHPNQCGVAIWPFVTSKETVLFSRLYQTAELPATSVMEDFMAAIQSGHLSLVPGSASGWYDHQLFTLETLALPARAQESDKLLLSARYKKRLREAFETILTKHRELAQKSVRTCLASAQLSETPELSVEPTATYYLRVARSYVFLQTRLRSLLGEAELTRLLLGDGKSQFADELNRTVRLFYGLYLVVCDDIGMVPAIETTELTNLGSTNTTALIDGARRWLQNIETEPFLDVDQRVIVPVLMNSQGTKLRNWAVVGIRLTTLAVNYERPPRVAVSDTKTTEETASENPEALLQKADSGNSISWGTKRYVVPVLVFAEATTGSRPLTRAEFRALCDSCRTKEEVITALEHTGSPLK